MFSALFHTTIHVHKRTYKLYRQLPGGNRATVHLARDTSPLQTLVIVKKVVAHDLQQLARALAEVDLHRRLDHPHIVQLLASTSVDSHVSSTTEVYSVLALAEQGHLWEFASSKPLSASDKLRVLRETASAIACVHSHGFIHMDIKLENVLVDCDGRCLLCDFGSAWKGEVSNPSHLSKRERLELEEHIQQNCTPMYCAPELIDLHSPLLIGPAVDVWALGCILYTLCFGLHPFGEASAVSILSANWCPPAGAIVDDGFMALIGAMLRARPEARPSAAAITEGVKYLESLDTNTTSHRKTAVRLSPLEACAIEHLAKLLNPAAARVLAEPAREELDRSKVVRVLEERSQEILALDNRLFKRQSTN